MRPRSLLVLLAVVLALGAFVWFFERDLPGSEEREAQAKRLVPGLEVAAVTAFEVESGGERVRIERVAAPEGGAESADEAEDAEGTGFDAPVEPAAEWRIAAPERFAGARADRVAVEGLLSAVAALERSRTLEEIDRQALGLAAPRARLTIERGSDEGGDGGDGEGGPIVLAAGADLPASSDMVVLREDTGEAHVVDRTVLQDLTRAAGDWRARQLVAAERQDVRRITLAGGEGGPVVLERAAEGGGFRVVRPLEDVADPAAVDQLLGALTGLTADRFVDSAEPSPAALGLDPPRARVRAELASGAPPVEVAIGAPRPEGDGYTFRVGRQLFVAETPLGDLAARPPRQWRSPAITALELYRVDRVTVEDGEDRVVLERSGTDWRRDGASISYTPVSDLLFALVEARADEVVPRAEAGPLGEPRLTVTLAASGEGTAGDEAEEGEPAEPAATETIVFHAPAEGIVPVTVAGRSAVLRVPETAVEAIRAHLAAVRAAPPIAAAADGDELPEGVEVERDEGL